MAPPGRRRFSHSPLTVFIGLVFLFSSTASAASAVLGIDLGTEYIKAALVKPGIPLEIVLTKDSKRKELSAVAFKPLKSGQLSAGSFPERFYGSDAVALQARFPADVYPNLKQLLGIPSENDAVKVYTGRYPAVDVSGTAGRKTVSLNSQIFAEGEKSFSVEELLAMELQNVKDNAKTLAGKGVSIDDAVFTVPPYYTVDERRALEVAAKLAGLKVLSIITDGLAVGINYATTRTFPVAKDGAKPEVNLIFDMGAGSTSAAVLQFQGKQVKDIGRFNKTIQEVQVLGTGWDRTFGGDSLNELIFNDMVSEFVKVPGAKSASITAEKVKSHGRTAAKLWKESEKIRQVLSANTQTTASFEDLYEEVDFKYKITRSKYEELTTDYVARIDGTINRALEAAGLKIADIDSVIVHGGATRTPFVQSRLEELVGKAKIRANVNSDEAAVFGAAFKAADLSPSFRVKEIRDIDTQGYVHGIQYKFNLKDRDQKIFTPSTKIGAPKDIPFQMMGEFSFDMYQALPGAGDEIVKAPVLHFTSGNLTRVVTKLIDDEKCDRESFNNYVQVRLSPITGTPEVTAAWVTCEADLEESKGGIVDGIKGFFGGGKKDQEALKEGESSSESASASKSSSKSATKSSSSAASASTSEDAMPKKKEVRSAHTYTVTLKGYEKHPRKELKRMQDRLSGFDASDKTRRVREEVLNSLEAFTYRARDYLEDESFIGASTAAIRSTLEEKLSAASDWIYAEGHEAPENVLNARLKELKDIVEPILKRKDEAAKRPEAIKELKSAIEDLKSVIPMVKDQVESAASSSSSASEASKSSASASSSTTPSADPLEELEDEDTASSDTTSSEFTIPTDIPTVYTPADLELIEVTVEKSSKWLADKEAAQNKLTETDDPALTVKDIKAEAKKLNDAIMEIMSKKMRGFNQYQEQQKQSKKAKASAKSKSKKAKKTKKAKASEEATPTAEESAATPSPSKQPTDEELNEELQAAFKKAGIKGADGIKMKNMGDVPVPKDKDGNPMARLELGEDATEEDIKAAIDRAIKAGQEEKKKREAEKDEL